MNAVVTLCTEAHSELGQLTHPTLEAYAHRVGADFVVIRERRYDAKVPAQYEKYQMGELLRKYERLIYLDTDLVVRSTTPNLLEMVPPGHWGGYDESHLWKRKEDVQRQFQQFTLPPDWSWDGAAYLNSGVAVLDRAHEEIFKDPPITGKPYWDQPWFSFMLRKLGLPIRLLPAEFNCMRLIFAPHRELASSAYIVHAAGAKLNAAQKLKALKQTLAEWQEHG